MDNEHDDAFPAVPNHPTRRAGDAAEPAERHDRPVPAARKVKKRSFWGGMLKSIFVTVLILSLLLNFYLAAIVFGGLREREYRPGDSKEKIALIEVGGTIDMKTVQSFREMLHRAAEDEAVKGVILVINSPGGQVAPSDMGNQFVRLFRQETGKKVYSVIEQVGASGAYWLAAGTDKIYAQENAMVGSIGVIYVNLVLETALNEKLGISPVVIKSSKSPFKDRSSPFRMPTEAEKSHIQAELDKIHERFVRVVGQGRKLSLDDAWALADGEVYDGQGALQKHLIDRVGYVENAIEAMADELGLVEPMVVRYVRPPSLKDVLMARRSGGVEALDISRLLEKLVSSPRIWAIWEESLPAAMLGADANGRP